MLLKYGERTRNLWGRFYYFILVFYVLGVILMKQLFHLRLLDIRCLQPTRCVASHIQRALVE